MLLSMGLFHFTQAIIRQIQFLGFQSNYQNKIDRKFAHNFYQLIALALILSEEI